jgi:hypothetical protein
MGTGRAWTDDELKLLASFRYTDEQLAKMIGRTVVAVGRKRRRLGGSKYLKHQSDKYANGVCDLTCPDYCPHKDCMLSGHQILAEQYKRKKVTA